MWGPRVGSVLKNALGPTEDINITVAYVRKLINTCQKTALK